MSTIIWCWLALSLGFVLGCAWAGGIIRIVERDQKDPSTIGRVRRIK